LKNHTITQHSGLPFLMRGLSYPYHTITVLKHLEYASLRMYPQNLYVYWDENCPKS